VTNAIDWTTAKKAAALVSGREPLAESYHYVALQPQFEELTAIAEEAVAAEIGFSSLAGPARARVVDRAQWIDANIGAFGRLLRPILRKVDERIKPGVVQRVGSHVTGAQLGAVLGWMSTRVLGQYDLLVIEGEDEEHQDVVYYVGPNVLALEKRFGFPPRQFRQWLALHEVAHRMQFTGVPWLREHFISLVHSTVGEMDPDPKRFVDAFKRVADDMKAGRDPLADGGLAALFTTPEQRGYMLKLQGLMSLLEGHGDWVMNRAGAGLVPDADRFHRILAERRASASGVARLFQRMIGLEAKMKQYEEGEEFIEFVYGEGGQSLFDLVWAKPENLPDQDEIRDPAAWITRVHS
jgi:coenzyme F420 biosynthesis associated uncharacterized protein